VVRNLEIVGEAAKRLSESVRALAPEVPWKAIAGMRDKLVHDYFGLNLEIFWQTVEREARASAAASRNCSASRDEQRAATASSEDELLPISALQHLLFCERQCALIHLEGLWADNDLTVEGQHLHSRVHQDETERRGELRVLRGLRIQSLMLGLVGRCDVVEFHQDGSVFPVEYKRGRPKRGEEDRVQLCAQALCLEEMYAKPAPSGAIFYGRTRRRLEVECDERLRTSTVEAVRRLRELVGAGVTPRAVVKPKCRRCSLLHLCLPEAMSEGRVASRYAARALTRSIAEELPEVDA
jgi:CRISPR-associated exonuclease Cas4